MSEFSKEIQISIEVAAELFTSLIAKTYQGVAGFVKDKNKERDFFGAATKKYVGGLIGRYNTVQVLGMREPVPLKSLFVRANILEKISARKRLRPEELAAFFDFDRRALGARKETVDGEKIVNKLKKFIVLGKPGAGKTTYLKYLTLMMLDKYSQIKRRRLPIFVTLRSWADEPVPLMDFIAQEFDTCGFEEAGAFVERMLNDGECIVLFDGLDEVSETAKQDDIIRQIKNFADKYAENQFIVSCRVAAYNHWLEGFIEVEMADFNEKQIEKFIRNWFQGEPKVATECWESLKNNSPLRELASVPLLLTLLCLEYDESYDFPPNRSELYHRAIETLLTKWDSNRRIRRQEVYKNLTIKRKESMFARIAWETFTINMYLIREMQLMRMIEKFIEHLPGFKEEELYPESKSILKAIEAQHGIFIERANGIYSFAHLTFQEYFTARYITDHTREGILENFVEKHLLDSKWKEVFLLTAGLLDNADDLLFLMICKVNEVLDVPEMNALMMAVEKSLLHVESKYPSVIRRNLAVFIALNRVSYIDHHSPTNTRALELIRTLVRTLTPTLLHDLNNILGDDTLSKHFQYTLEHILEHIFDLDLDSARVCVFLKRYKKVNDPEKHIQGYCYANTLIINCLEAANYVSKDVREKMLHEIFLPKRE